MAEGRWTELDARAVVSRTNGICAGKQVWHPRPGIKVLGAIDYLIKKHKYIRVADAPTSPKKKKDPIREAIRATMRGGA
ncbi:MAG: hypothetical protein ACXABY_02615 [Candidatus Thorarchaeota archaeon]|jgi:hypothetical protein